jgi:hypothetical protein
MAHVSRVSSVLASCSSYGLGSQHQSASLPLAMLCDPGHEVGVEGAIEDIQTTAGGSAFQGITRALTDSSCSFKR